MNVLFAPSILFQSCYQGRAKLLLAFGVFLLSYPLARGQVPAAPTISSPGGTSSPGTMITTLRPTMNWSASSGATGYGLYVRNETTGSLVYDNDYVSNSTSLTLPSGTLVAGNNYSWNMRAKNASGWSGFSSKRYFVTEGAVPAAPSISSPGGTSSPGTTITTLRPTMNWSASSGATGYGLYVRNETTGSLVYDNDYVSNSTSLTLPSGTLVAGNNYSWNMRAKNASGWSGFSSKRYFVTEGAVPAAPSISSPGGTSSPGTTITTLRPTMNWSASSGATGYGLYVRNETTGSLVYDNDYVSNSTSLTLPSGTLVAGNNYSWNMRAKNASGWSGFSSKRYFVTEGAVPAAPSISSPGGTSSPGTTITTLRPTMNWSASSGATGYGLYVRNETTGSLVYDNDYVSNSTSLTLPSGTLVAGNNYSWNMRAKNASGWSGFSSKRYFVTEGAVPPAPTIVSPGTASSPGTTVATLTPTVSWTAVTGAARYSITVSKSPYGAANAVYTNNNLSGTSHAIPSGKLLAGTAYRWQMSAFNSADQEGAYSNILYFQTQAAVSLPPAPTIVSPGTASSPGTTVATLTPTVSWTAVTGAARYSITVSKSPYGAANAVYTNNNLSGTSHAIPSGKLLAGTAYRWQMSAFNSADQEGAYSNILYFRTQAAVSLPPAPTIVSPGTASSPGTTVATLTPTVSWTAVTGAARYSITVSKSPYGAANAVYTNNNLSGTSHAIPSGKLLAGTAYRWQMSAFNSAGQEGAYSNILYFQTQAAVSVTITKITPSSILALVTDQPIHIEGSGFNNTPAAPTLEIDSPMDKGMVSRANKLTYVSSSKITYNINTGGETGKWRLRVKNPNGTYSNWREFDVIATQSTTPTAPSNLVAMLTTGGAVTLAWSDNSNNESGFRIQRRVGSSTTWTEITTTGTNITSATDAAVSAGNTYTYRVLAFNATGNSAASASASLTYPTSGAVAILITAPTASSTWLAGESRQITWTPSGNVQLISHYRAYFSLNAGSSYDEISPSMAVTGNSRTWNIPSTMQSTQARVKVIGYSTQGAEVTSHTSSNFSIQVPVLKPVSRPDASNNGPMAGEIATFRGTASTAPSGRTISAYSWNMGDGASKSGATVSHSFARTGVYQVTLTVTDSAGQTNARSLAITVTGNAVGINNGSAMFADPVNLANGNFILEAEDISIPGMGFPIKFGRFYNSKAVDATGLPMGFNWTHSYNLKLTEEEGLVKIALEDGRVETHTQLPDGSYLAERGVFDRLTRVAASRYILSSKDQIHREFNNGRLASIRDRNGNSHTLEYNAQGQLARILDTSGRFLSFTYNAAGRIETIVDPLPRTIRYAYNASGDLISVTDARGGATRYTYDSPHQMLTATDPNGNVFVTNVYDDLQRVVALQKDAYGAETRFSYDFTTRLTTVTDPFGHKTYHQHDEHLRLTAQTNENGHTESFDYDLDNNRTLVVDRNGHATRYSYDSRGNVLSKTDPYQNKTFITYNANNDPIRRLDPLGHVTEFAYDARGNLIRTTDAMGRSAQIEYNAQGKPVKLTDRRGNATNHGYDAAGDQVTTTDADGRQTTMTYDKVGRLLTTRDPLGHTTVQTYDGNNNLLSIRNPLNQTISYEYDANDNRTKITDARGNATTYEFDAKDRLVKVVDADAKTTRHEYDAYDRKTKTIDARGNTTRFEYDPAGRQIATINPLNERTEFQYDKTGNRIAVKDPLGRTTRMEYDRMDRLVAVVDPLGNRSETRYDRLGRKTESLDPLRRPTRYTYDPMGRLLTVTDPAGGVVRYSWDPEGNKLTATNPLGRSTSHQYDKLNRLVRRVEPNNRVEAFEYNAVGNLVRRTDAKGQTTRYEYDANRRMLRTIYPDNSQVVVSYDANGNRLGVLDSLGTSAFLYDKLNRMTRYTNPFGTRVDFLYDENSNRTSVTYPGSRAVNYSYDAANRMSTVVDWLSRTTRYTYNTAGDLLETQLPNNTRTNHTYDTAGRLASLINHGPASTMISSYAYTLDAVGNHRSVDAREPAEGILSPSLTNYTYDVEDRMISAGGAAHTYDANGNLLAAGKQMTLRYDFENRLVETREASGALYTFRYDGFGNRLERTFGGNTERYLLDPSGSLSQVLGVFNTSGAGSEFFVYGLGLICKVDAAHNAEFFHYDSRGSTIAVTNGGGQIQRAYAYDPFGQSLAVHPQSASDRFQYLGRHGVVRDPSGLYHVRARYYSTAAGRFISKDPFRGFDDQSQTLNRYVYALNNPVRLIDISGYSARESLTKSSSNFSSNMRNQMLVALDHVSDSKIVEILSDESLISGLGSIYTGGLGIVGGVVSATPGLTMVAAGIKSTLTGVGILPGIKLISLGVAQSAPYLVIAAGGAAEVLYGGGEVVKAVSRSVNPWDGTFIEKASIIPNALNSFFGH
jgi:RHS repeat-associated protein